MTAPRRLDNRYDLVRPVGQGGMGVVWEAKDALLNRRVAIKEIKLPASVPDEEQEAARARLLREARAAARLQHPSAVTVYTVVTDGAPYIVMEFVDAPSLTELVRREGTLSPERAAKIGLQMVDCLQAAHAADIVHRDVKPSNVLVVSDPQLGVDRVKLTDFGIARMAGDLKVTMTGAVLGSPPYMSPEQATDRPTTPGTDYWGLGATLYYAVEGEPPFQREQPMLTMHAVVSEPPRTPVKAGPLGPVILALLRKDPATRPTGATVTRMLEQAAGTVPGQPAAGPIADAPTTTLPPVNLPPPPFRPTAAAEPLVTGPASGQPPPPAFTDYPDYLDSSYGRRPARRRGEGLRWAAAIVLLCALFAGAVGVGYLALHGHGKKGNAGNPPPSGLTNVPSLGPTATKRTTSGPSPSASPSAAALPAGCKTAPGGWKPQLNQNGKYCFGVPAGWKAAAEPQFAQFNSVAATPTDGGLRFIRAQSQPSDPASDPMTTAQQLEQSFRTNNENYRQVRMEDGQWAGQDAVFWEFTYSKDGQDLHSLDVLFNSDNGYGYAVLMRSTAGDWGAFGGVRSQFERTFNPLT